MKQELRYEELTLAKVKEMRNWDKKRGAPRNLEILTPFGWKSSHAWGIFQVRENLSMGIRYRKRLPIKR
jgi:hypothetical protein